jgi:hypothetical protein
LLAVYHIFPGKITAREISEISQNKDKNPRIALLPLRGKLNGENR